MVVRKRKRSTRFRRSTTHGWGAMKKHRGAGNRGGRGRSGAGGAGTSHSGSKKPSFWKVKVGGKDPAKRGFASKVPVDVSINVGHLNSIATQLVVSGKALEQSGKIAINLKELGYTKLLGAGKVTHKLNVTVAGASPKAEEKIKKAGGVLNADYVTGQEDVFEEVADGEDVEA